MPSTSRRTFLKKAAALLAASAAPMAQVSAASERGKPFLVRDFRSLHDKIVACQLCPQECVIALGKRGQCGVRENRNGQLLSLVYGRPVTANIDPIEKKPLFHFLPGTLAYSIATVGCNIRCKFCQNWQISQIEPEKAPVPFVSPNEIAGTAKAEKCESIAYTYTEPTVFTEYVEDCAVEGKKLGVRSVSISNGFIRKPALLRLCQKLDAVKIDLKSFSDKFYRNICSGKLKPVLETLETLGNQNIWFEIVVLIIPTLNDSEKEITDMCKWIYAELGPDIPLHFTRFSPNFLLKNLPPTPVPILKTAWRIAKDAGLHYVYLGNVPGHKAENTYCHHCDKKVVSRYGFWVKEIKIKSGKCSYCGQVIPGIWV